MALTLLVEVLLAIVSYYVGRKHGYQAGREHELDNTAQRHERMKRFSNYHL